jgi:Holliday junction resolvase-like predicted endonuclease
MIENPLNVKLISQDGETITLNFLELQQVTMIDEALSSVGDYGEIRLIVEKGKLRFLVTQKSFDALKWVPGNLAR